jgi:hypothetical protein
MWPWQAGVESGNIQKWYKGALKREEQAARAVNYNLDIRLEESNTTAFKGFPDREHLAVQFPGVPGPGTSRTTAQPSSRGSRTGNISHYRSTNFPGFPDREHPALPLNQVLGVPWQEHLALPLNQFPGIPGPEHLALPLNQVPGVPRPEHPALPLNQVPGVPRPEHLALPLNQVPGVPRPEHPALPLNQVPGVPGPEHLALPLNQVTGVPGPGTSTAQSIYLVRLVPNRRKCSSWTIRVSV